MGSYFCTKLFSVYQPHNGKGKLRAKTKEKIVLQCLASNI